MNQDKKVSIIGHSAFAVIVIALMTLLCFKNSNGVYIDLAINHSLSNAQSLYGIIFSYIGEYPQYFLMPISIMLLFYNTDRIQNKNIRIALKVLAGIGVYGGWAIFAFASQMSKTIASPTKYIVAVVVVAVMGTITLLYGRYISKNTAHKLLKFAVFALAFVAASYVIITILKVLWCRMRYRDLLTEGTFEYFTPWFRPMVGRADKIVDKGYSYTSFPSGHTSAACHLFIITLLPFYFKKLDKKWIKNTLYAVAILFTIIVAISRIVNDAHYLSDTIMGGTITYIIFYVLKCMFFKNKKYEFSEKNK